MIKYLKLFDTHTDYNTYINRSDKVLPNVSYCENENEVHYNPWVETRVVVKINVTDTTNPTYFFNNPTILNEVEIDGVIQPSAVNSYTFETTGEHTVKIKLNDGITTLNSGSFAGQAKVVSITIPNSITSIGDYTCSSCTALTNVTIPDSVTTIGKSAFGGCTALTSVVIPNSVTTIGDNAFYGCTSLTSVTLNSIAVVSKIYTSSLSFNNIFGNQVTEYIIGNSVTSIGDYAFNGCTNLTNIIIGNDVTTIGENAFRYCTGLISVTIPNSVTTISNYSFISCSGLTNITIGNGVTTIGSYAFFNCTGLTSVIIGNSVTEIRGSAFKDCTGLTSIISLATTAPTIESDTFQLIKTEGTLTVPSGSTGYDVWMGTGNYYLGKYNWTKVEQ